MATSSIFGIRSILLMRVSSHGATKAVLDMSSRAQLMRLPDVRLTAKISPSKHVSQRASNFQACAVNPVAASTSTDASDDEEEFSVDLPEKEVRTLFEEIREDDEAEGNGGRMWRKQKVECEEFHILDHLPQVAIVGRPNVGKSALFNRLAGGVTRDRLHARAFWGEQQFMLVDSPSVLGVASSGITSTDGIAITNGGREDAVAQAFKEAKDGDFPGLIEKQAATAVEDADSVIFVVDGQTGPTSADIDIAQWLRKKHPGKRVTLAVNKCESPTTGGLQAAEFRSLGFTPIAVSAISGAGTGDVLDSVCLELQTPKVTLDDIPEEERSSVISIIGRPNGGKTNILNALAGEEQTVVSPVSGKTRDAIDTDITVSDGQNRSRHPTAGLNGQSLTATDLARGLLDVQGWKVLRNETGEEVGIVDEIIHIGPPDSDEIYESVLKLVQVSPPEANVPSYTLSEEEGSDEDDGLEFLIPLVEDIVKSVDIKSRCLFITPPAGLLELARIPEILKRLEPQLLEFCQHQNAGIRSCLNSVEAHQSTRFSDDAKQRVASSRNILSHDRDVFMPTRRQLLSAGRHDLVEEIMVAGGFLSVAQALGLRSRRRPVGFWEDLRNLDAEIEWFVCGCWVVQQSPETGEELYYNQATKSYSRQKPSAGNVSNPVPVSQEDDDIGTAVMPRQQQVLEAGRYDLHHAILLHGGYKLVAQELGRQPVSRDNTTELVAKLRNFMEENSLSRFPSFDELRTLERFDLVYSLRKHGGINAVAQMMDLRPKRYGKGQWYSLDCAAAAIRSYMCNSLILKRGLSESSMDQLDLENMVWNEAVRTGTLEIPTQLHVLQEGRSDIRYLLQKYGRKDLADYLGINCVDRRRKKKKGSRAQTSSNVLRQ